MAWGVSEDVETSFIRYLTAKRSVDDRALNRNVWQALCTGLAALPPAHTLRVLEIGAGVGSMVERALEWGLFAACTGPVRYTAIDSAVENIAGARQRLASLAPQVDLTLVAADFFDFAHQPQAQGAFDLVIAHAVLDLLDLERALPLVRALLTPDGYGYFTINFDGVTTFQPEIDPAFDAQVEALYHRTMDERLTGGVQSGDSRTGRHLFGALTGAGMVVRSAGASDWVVFADAAGRYPHDEAYFLHFIVNTIDQALRTHSELDQQRFAHWIEQRHRQIDAGKLIYVAHQLDFLARVTPALLSSPAAPHHPPR